MGSRPANTWSGYVSFQIQPSNEFDATVVAAAKENYKKDRQGKEQFLAMLEPFFEDLEQDGERSHFLSPEPWPHGQAQPGWSLYKYRFHMPRLSGAARHGRVIVAINLPLSFIYPIMAYTHKQYGSRPPQRAIAGLLRSAIADAQAIAGQQPG
jgi:hypothetical protein